MIPISLKVYNISWTVSGLELKLSQLLSGSKKCVRGFRACAWERLERAKTKGQVSDVLPFIVGATNPINLAGSRMENTADERLVIMHFAHQHGCSCYQGN